MSEKNNRLWLGIFLGVLASLVVVLVGYVVYDKVLSEDVEDVVDNKNDFNNNSNEQQKQEVTIDLSLDDSIVKDLSDKVIGVYTNNMITEYYDYFYKKDKVVLSEEDMSFKLSLVAESVSGFFSRNENGYDCSNGICGISYASEELIKDAYFELFGKDSKYERASFSVANCEGMQGYNWSEVNNRYEAEIHDGCGGTSFGGTISKLGYAKQTTSSNLDRIELYEYFAYEDLSAESDIINYYSDYNRTNLITSTSENYTKEEFFNEFSNQAGVYKYIFEKDKNGSYVFTSVEKVK